MPQNCGGEDQNFFQIARVFGIFHVWVHVENIKKLITFFSDPHYNDSMSLLTKGALRGPIFFV